MSNPVIFKFNYKEHIESADIEITNLLLTGILIENKQLHFQTRILIKILEELQSHLINFPLKLPIGILIKIIEEFHKISAVI